MAKYRKKPIVVEAFKWTGGPDQEEDPEWIIEALKKDFFSTFGGARIIKPNDKIMLELMTLEGRMHANVGDYIIKDIKGELYPCKPDIFEATYEEVEVVEDVFEIRIPNLKSNEVQLVKDAVKGFAKELLNRLQARRNIIMN
jgi:hypothetical protein